jgi:hypothetical protein
MTSKKTRRNIPVNRLDIDPDVQRGLNPAWVQELAERFEIDMVGTIAVSQRSNGQLFIVDGQHRHAAALAAGYDGTFDCSVFTGLTLPEEAGLFLALNNRKVVNAIDKFRVRVVRGDEAAVALNDVITGRGWTIGDGGRARIAAVTKLEAVVDGAGIAEFSGDGIELVDNVLRTVTEAWNYAPRSAHANIVSGMGALYARYGWACRPKLTKELTKATPNTVLAKANAIRDGQAGLIGHAVAKVLVGLHNHAVRQDNRLPEWTWTR